MDVISSIYEFVEDFSSPCMFFDDSDESKGQLPRTSLRSIKQHLPTVSNCSGSNRSTVNPTRDIGTVVDSTGTTKKDSNGVFDSNGRKPKKNDARALMKQKSGGSRLVRTMTTVNDTKSQNRSSMLETLSEHARRLEQEFSTLPISKDKNSGKFVDV